MYNKHIKTTEDYYYCINCNKLMLKTSMVGKCCTRHCYNRYKAKIKKRKELKG